ncbi:hypothetical protein BDR04DRAFT_1115162 [Suillus decipiens]|nr:hypothetical protein BDR04DRAFT_1115162 [Suillus decipiens]
MKTSSERIGDRSWTFQAFEGCDSLRRQLNIHFDDDEGMLSGRIAFLTEFSNLLQKPDIEGHRAMYLAIVNHQREAVSAFAAFIPRFSSVCSSDVRLALFAQLNSTCVINYEVQVEDRGDRQFTSQFSAHFCIRMFQKRLRVTRKLDMEFVANANPQIDLVIRVEPGCAILSQDLLMVTNTNESVLAHEE